MYKSHLMCNLAPHELQWMQCTMQYSCTHTAKIAAHMQLNYTWFTRYKVMMQLNGVVHCINRSFSRDRLSRAFVSSVQEGLTSKRTARIAARGYIWCHPTGFLWPFWWKHFSPVSWKRVVIQKNLWIYFSLWLLTQLIQADVMLRLLPYILLHGAH